MIFRYQLKKIHQMYSTLGVLTNSEDDIFENTVEKFLKKKNSYEYQELRNDYTIFMYEKILTYHNR